MNELLVNKRDTYRVQLRKHQIHAVLDSYRKIQNDSRFDFALLFGKLLQNEEGSEMEGLLEEAATHTTQLNCEEQKKGVAICLDYLTKQQKHMGLICQLCSQLLLQQNQLQSKVAQRWSKVLQRELISLKFRSQKKDFRGIICLLANISSIKPVAKWAALLATHIFELQAMLQDINSLQQQDRQVLLIYSNNLARFSQDHRVIQLLLQHLSLSARRTLLGSEKDSRWIWIISNFINKNPLLVLKLVPVILLLIDHFEQFDRSQTIPLILQAISTSQQLDISSPIRKHIVQSYISMRNDFHLSVLCQLKPVAQQTQPILRSLLLQIQLEGVSPLRLRYLLNLDQNQLVSPLQAADILLSLERGLFQSRTHFDSTSVISLLESLQKRTPQQLSDMLRESTNTIRLSIL